MTASTSARSPQKACRKPNRPSTTVGGPVSPWRARLGGDDAGVGGPAAVHPLDGAAGAVGLEQARAHARRDRRPRRRSRRRPGPSSIAAADGRADRAADRGGVQAALEEHRVAELAGRSRAMPSRTATSMPTPAASSSSAPVAPRASATASAAGTTDERRVQHRRQVGVVEVERVRQRAVDQRGGGAGTRSPVPIAWRRACRPSRRTSAVTAVAGAAALRSRPGCCRSRRGPGGRRPARSSAGQALAPDVGGERGRAAGRCVGARHADTAANGRTGEPVPPTMRSGASTKTNR